jgi:hypothetical protein
VATVVTSSTVRAEAIEAPRAIAARHVEENVRTRAARNRQTPARNRRTRAARNRQTPARNQRSRAARNRLAILPGRPAAGPRDDRDSREHAQAVLLLPREAALRALGASDALGQ